MKLTAFYLRVANSTHTIIACQSHTGGGTLLDSFATPQHSPRLQSHGSLRGLALPLVQRLRLAALAVAGGPSQRKVLLWTHVHARRLRQGI